MTRTVKVFLLLVVLAPLGYMMLAFGEYVSAGIAPTSLSINAFLFLMGLGGAFALLSPPFYSRMRPRF